MAQRALVTAGLTMAVAGLVALAPAGPTGDPTSVRTAEPAGSDHAVIVPRATSDGARGGEPRGTLYFSRDFDGEGLHTLSMVDGAAVQIGTTGVDFGSVGLAPSGNESLLYGTRPSELLHINSDGSGATGVGGGEAQGLAYDAETETLYGCQGFFIFTVNPDTGERIETLQFVTSRLQGLAFARGGVYAVAGGAERSLLFYDPGANEWSVVGDTGQAWSEAGLAYNPCEDRLYAKRSDDTALYRIDLDTAETTVVGDTGLSRGGGLAWAGRCEDEPCGGCVGDLDLDGVVGFTDLVALLAQWGPCARPGPAIEGLVGLRSTAPAQLYRLDILTGAADPALEPNGEASFAGLAHVEAFGLYASDVFDYPGESGDIDTGRIDLETGAIEFVNDQDGSSNWHGLAADTEAGLLYSVDVGASGFPLKVVDLMNNGSVSTVGGGTGVDGRGLAFDPISRVLYATHGDNTLHRIDVADGTSESIGPLGVVTGSRVGLAWDAANSVLYMNVGPASSLYRVDVGTGAATRIGSNGVSGIDGLAYITAASPCACRADLDLDGEVGFTDLVQLLSAWGGCP